MTKNEQNTMMLLMSSVSLATLANILPSNGSALQDFIQGVVTGVAIVGCIAGLWAYSKARKSKAQ